MPAVSKKQREAMAAYVAGFLDGEGNITILKRNQNERPNPSYDLHVGFTNRDLSALQVIQSFYGGTIFQKKRYRANHATSYELRIGRKAQVARLLQESYPYMLIKQKQAELALAFLKMPRVRMEKTADRGKSWPLFKANESDIACRAKLKSELTELNKKGVDVCLQ